MSEDSFTYFHYFASDYFPVFPAFLVSPGENKEFTKVGFPILILLYFNSINDVSIDKCNQLLTGLLQAP